jgi:phosphoribosyl 1,2-cyclic phosphodiesterase
VGWRIRFGSKILVYNSDLVDIIEKDKVLTGVDVYIGDGSAVKTNLVRRRGDVLFGHTRITTQLHWCEKYGIERTIFTHLGKETLREEKEFKAAHPGITLAYDGLEMQI